MASITRSVLWIGAVNEQASNYANGLIKATVFLQTPVCTYKKGPHDGSQ